MVCEIMLWMAKGYEVKLFCYADLVIADVIYILGSVSALTYLEIDVKNLVTEIFYCICKWRLLHNLAEVCLVVTVNKATKAPSIFFQPDYSVSTPYCCSIP